MAKRKKNRTHRLKSNTTPSNQQPSPKSFIIKSTPAHHTSSNKNGIKSDSYNSTSLNLLVKDFRKVMEPNTASNLKERKSNRFKDFLAMAGPLGVTHMIVFSQSLTRSKSIHQDHLKEEEIMSSINLKIYKVPRGPTLSFKVLRYSLMIDILNADKSPRSPGQEFKTEPLLIMNNFNPTPTTTPDEANQLNLLTTTFRNLFPQIKIQEIQLIQTRRIVLLSYNPMTKTIDFRHYLITVKPIGVSKSIRKLIEGSIINSKSESEPNQSNKKRKRVLDLSGVEDLAEYVLGQSRINKTKGPASITSSGGFTSAQSELETSSMKDDVDTDLDGMSSGAEDESENEIHENKIELPQHYLGKGNLKNSKKSIKLKELGPRLELGLVKIEQGLGNGDVLFHEFIKKTKEEDVKIKKTIKEKEKLRLSRKAEQDANVKKKKLALEAKKEMKANKRKEKKEAGEEEEEEDEEEEEEEEEEVEGEGKDEEDESEGSEIDEDAEYSDLFDDEDLLEVQSSESSEESSSEEEEEEEDRKNKKKKSVRFTKS